MKAALGNDLILGRTSEGQGVLFPYQARSTHLYVCGGTGTGKSKFLENMIRQDIKGWRKSKCGMLVLDPHGSLYDSIMRWGAWNEIDRPIVPIDLRQNDFVIAYNVLRQRKVADQAVIARNFVQAMAHVWGQSGTDQTPLFARWAYNIISTLYEKQHTLLEAEYLIDRIARENRQSMTSQLKSRAMTRDWAFINSLSPKDFEQQISSTANRLHSFLSTQAIRQMFGLKGQSLDLGRALDEGQIILVSLATEKGRVSDEDASLFATLLLSDLWTAARERGKDTGKPPFYVYLDEFQRFVTPTIAQNLDEARGFGLHLTLAHQFPNQLLHTGENGKQVYDSIMVNARSKVVFSIEGEENLKPLAQSLFMGTMSPEKIKLELYSTKVMDYVEEERITRGQSTSESEGEGSQSGMADGEGEGQTQLFAGDPEDPQRRMKFPFEDDEPEVLNTSKSTSKFKSGSSSQQKSKSRSKSQSETTNSMLMPVMGQELSSVQFESLEEQLHRAMNILLDQQQRQCVARMVGIKTPIAIKTPTVTDTPPAKRIVEKYTQKLLNRWPFAFTEIEAQRLLTVQEQQFESALLSSGLDEPETARKRLT